MTFFTVLIAVIIGIVCSIIHKNKGYSPIAGFCWGFFFSFIGLAVVLLEKTKEEHMQNGKKELSVAQWFLIFLGVGTFLIVLYFTMLSLF